jgi:hypothetical protein
MNHTAGLTFERQCIFLFTIGLGEPAVMPHHCRYVLPVQNLALKGDFEPAVLLILFLSIKFVFNFYFYSIV